MLATAQLAAVPGVPGWCDHLLLVVVGLLVPLLDWRWTFPRLRRAAEAGVAGARRRFYAELATLLWLLCLAVMALWLWRGRPLSKLGLGLGTPWRCALVMAVAAAYLVYVDRVRRAIAARPERLLRLYRSMGVGAAMVPRTTGERAAWAGVSVTAGITEEILFRGFVLWYFTAWGGMVFAVVASSLVFGCAHLYLGASHVLRAAILGLIFALFTVAAGSLWAAMLLHAATDLIGGSLGYLALRQISSAAGDALTPAAAAGASSGAPA